MIKDIFSIKKEIDDTCNHFVITILGFHIKLRQELKNNNGLTLNYLETHLCDHCNLKCKGCGHNCDEIKDEIFADINQYEKDINELSKKIKIRKIRLLGGEPLLHPEVEKFISATRKAFPKSSIHIVTNGILIPSMKEDFWETCRKCKAKIDITQYPILKDKFPMYKKIIRKNKVELGSVSIVKKFGNKADYKGKSNYIKSFQSCGSKYCVNLWKSKLWTCPACYREYVKEKFSKDFELPLSLDIYNVTGKEIIEKMNKPVPACRFCKVKGVSFDWQRAEN